MAMRHLCAWCGKGIDGEGGPAPRGRQRLYLRISTEKVGDAVLLRMD